MDYLKEFWETFSEISTNKYQIITGENGCRRMVSESIPEIYGKSIGKRIEIAKTRNCNYVYKIYGVDVYLANKLK